MRALVVDWTRRRGRVAYVSCDPASFARDLRIVLDQGGRSAHCAGFDLFPMTEHVELLGISSHPARSG